MKAPTVEEPSEHLGFGVVEESLGEGRADAEGDRGGEAENDSPPGGGRFGHHR